MADLTFDLAAQPLRELNQFLHHGLPAGPVRLRILNPDGAHSIAVGVNAPIDIDIEGHAGYYAAGMNQQARVTVHGNAGPAVAENMMSGRVHVKGFASVAAGATGDLVDVVAAELAKLGDVRHERAVQILGQLREKP